MIRSAEWLANLTEYDCVRCNSKTIFKGICSECDSHEYNLERIEELRADIKRSQEEVADISRSILNKQDELKELMELEKLK